MLTRELMHGLYVLIITPFKDSFELDEAELRSNVRQLVNLGVDGIVANGTNGEFHTIDDDERRRVTEILVEECSGKAISVAGASGVNTAESIARTKMAREVGAEAVMNVVPYYHILSKPEVYQYFEDLNTAVPDIGVVIYNNPVTTQVRLDDEDFVRLQQIANVAGTKMIGADIGLYMNCLRRTSIPHLPLEPLWGVSHMVGGNGAMASFIYAFPGFMMRWWKAIQARNDTSALVMQHQCNELLQRLILPLIIKEGYNEIAATKATVDAAGFFRAGPVRKPFRPVPLERIDKLRGDIKTQFPQFLEA